MDPAAKRRGKIPEPHPPPAPPGRELTRCARPGRAGSGDNELRVTLDRYQGHPYVSVRLWWRSSDGWRPTRKGCSIRLAECEDVAQALLEAIRLGYAPPARLPSLSDLKPPVRPVRDQH